MCADASDCESGADGLDDREIFRNALQKSCGDERTAYLHFACGANSALRARIEEWIAQCDETALNITDVKSDPQVAAIGPSNLNTPPNSLTTSPKRPPSSDGMIATGARLGDYELLEVLGSGGMGIVTKALDTKLRRVVAIKTLSTIFAHHPQSRSRFLREAQAAAAVRHENVVAIYAVDDQGETPFLVMEHINGKSLQQRIEDLGPMPIPEVLRIGILIASGLAAAHDIGLVHRDIKPANILLDSDGDRVKITDFGLARAVSDIGITQTGQVAGTPQYMSPEQAQGMVVDHRSDLFSLGTVLYTMLSGQSPFRGESAVAVLRSVCDSRPAPIYQLRPEVSRSVGLIVEKLMSKRPERRFQTAREVASALKAELDGIHSKIPNQPAKSVSLAKKTARIPSIFAFVLVSAALAGVAIWLGGSPTRENSSTALPVRPVHHSGQPESGSTSIVPAEHRPAAPANLLLAEDYEWSDPVSLGTTINTPATEEHVAVANDGLTILFLRNQKLVQSQRPSLDRPFDEPILLPGPINDEGTLQSPYISNDGLQIWFASSRTGSFGHNDLWVSDRVSLLAPFSTPENLGPSINTEAEESTPWVSADGLTLFFCARRPGANGVDLFRATRGTRKEPFGQAVALDRGGPGGINTRGNQFSPHLTGDGLALIYTMTEPGLRQAFYLATRTSPDAPFGAPVELPGKINRGVVSSPALTPDGSILIYELARPDGQNRFDLWETRRIRKTRNNANLIDDDWRPLIQAGEPAATGVRQGTANWAVADGILRGETKQALGKLSLLPSVPLNFQLRCEVRLEGPGNSGIEVCLMKDGGLVQGYQLDITPSGIGRMAQLEPWTVLSNESEPVEDGEWSRIEITKTSAFLRRRVNDRFLTSLPLPVADEVSLDLEANAAKGQVAVEVRNLQIRALDQPESNSVTSGSALLFGDQSSFAKVPELVCQDRGNYTVEAWISPEMQSHAQCVLLFCGKSFLQIGKSERHLFPACFESDLSAEPQNPRFVPGEWIHVAAVSSERQVKLFVNGTTRLNLSRQNEQVQKAHPFEGFWIAAHPLDSNPNRFAYFYQGMIDEIRVSNVARYDNDFRPQTFFEPDESTLGLYHCDEGSGDELIDASGRGFHGQIIRPRWVKLKETSPTQ